MNSIESLVRPNIRALCPYSTARDEYEGKLGIFLDANESPYPTGWNRYPDPHQKALKEQISALKGVPPSYGMYAVAADINDIRMRQVPLGTDFSLPTEQLLAAADAHTKLLFLCSPNNPSGNAFEPAELEALIRRFPGIVVLDEAYADFSAKGSLRERLPELPNLIIFQTLSKAYGLAGLRLGMAFASPYIIRLMSMVKYPYNINQSTQELVSRALQTPIADRVAETVAQRARVAAALPAFRCVKRVYPSDANFLLVQVDDADTLYTHLLADGIIVRNRSRVPGCACCLRITIGLPSENDQLLQSLSAYEKGDIHR